MNFRVKKDGMKALCLLIIVVFLLGNFKTFFVLGSSMEPTYYSGDIVLVQKKSIQKLNRGDIVIAEYGESSNLVIKRLIGLSGDLVTIKENGTVLVNGVELVEPYVKYHGGAYGTWLVPDDGYFLLGDNRSASSDSRYWNAFYIRIHQIRGKVLFCE